MKIKLKVVDEVILIHLLSNCHRDKMSFLNIQDPEKRDAIVKEYLALKKKIKNRNLQEKARDFRNHEIIEESLEPVVRSTAESTEAITKQLLPIKEGITTLNANFKHSAAKDKKNEDLDSGERNKDKEKDKDGDENGEKDKLYEKLMQDGKAKNMDRYFGILYNDEIDKHAMSDKIVNLGEMGDIIVDGKTYKGTPGLWSLILLKRHTDFNEEDMEEYKKLVKQTNVMRHPQNQRANSQPKLTWKWRKIFNNLEKKGHGIEFLPSDIISLKQ